MIAWTVMYRAKTFAKTAIYLIFGDGPNLIRNVNNMFEKRFYSQWNAAVDSINESY